MRNKMFRQKLVTLPRVLEEQILIRCGLGIVSAVLGVILVFTTGIYLGLPWLGLAVYLLGSGMLQAVNCVSDAYTQIEGVCRQVERVGISKRIRSVVILVDDIPMRVQLRQRRIAIQEGDTVVIYASDRTPVYLKDGCDFLCSYYALQVKGEKKSVKA